MTRKTVKQALPAVDLKEMIVTALRSETMALYRRFAKEKSNDEVFTQDSRLGRIIVSLYGLIQWLFPDDQEISENFIYLVSARFPGYRHVADATVPSEPQEIPVNEAATIPTPSKVLEMPQHTTPVTALSEVKHVETPTGEVAPPVQNTEINTLLDFFQNVPNGTKPYDFSRKVREAYFGTSFTEIKEVLHTVIKRLPHLVDPEALRDCVAHQRDVELAQFFVQRGERILDTAQINQPAFVGVKGAMYAIAGMHDVANNPNVKAELEGKIVRICHMGCIDEYDILTGIACLEKVLKELGYKFELGVGLAAAQKVFNG